MSREFIGIDEHPVLTVGTKFGTVYVKFIDGSDLMFFSQDRGLEDRFLTVRGVEYRVNCVHVANRDGQGWKLSHSGYNFARRDRSINYATPSADKALSAELEAVAAKTAHENPEKLKIAERISLNNDASSLEDKIAELEKDLSEKRASLRKIEGRIMEIRVDVLAHGWKG